MPCPCGPPVLLQFGACPVETTLFPQGLEPPRGGVPRGLQPHVEVSPKSTSLVPPALLAAAYMATSAQKDP